MTPRLVAGSVAMNERRPFGPWTLGVGLAWVAGTALALLLIWRLWTGVPR